MRQGFEFTSKNNWDIRDQHPIRSTSKLQIRYLRMINYSHLRKR
jgi:hypothetical protein